MTHRLPFALLLFLCAFPVRAQGPVSPPPPAKDPPKPALEDLKLPPGAVLVLVERLKDALNPKAVLLSVEQYRAMVEKLRLAEAGNREPLRAPHSCKLTGKLEGDHLQLKADFAFVTQEPRTRVLLGFKGAYLTEEGILNEGLAPVDFREDGFVVEVAEPGSHRLSLPLQIPVGLKRATAPGGGAERAVDTTLPGAAVTTLSLELPAGVKELRWNDTLEKRPAGNRWELVLGKAKSLTMAWREPVVAPGSGPLTTVDTQVTVKLDEVQAAITAEMTLEDLRSQTRDWHLILPPGVRAEVRSPGGLPAELQRAEGKGFTHLVRLPEPSAERVVVAVQLVQPLPPPGGKLTVGPFLVQGAYRQQAAIRVQALPGAPRNERLVFHPHDDVFRKDPTSKSALDAAVFQFWNGPGTAKGKDHRGWLDIEWKVLPGRTEVRLDQMLDLVGTGEGRYLELTLGIQGKTEGRAADGLEIQLPLPSYDGLRAVAGLGGSFLAGGHPWSGWQLFIPDPNPRARPVEFTIRNDGQGVEAGPPDGNNRLRPTFPKGFKDEFQLVLQGRYEVPRGARRIVVELPQVLAALVRAGKTHVRTPDREEILIGPLGREEPVAERHGWASTWDRQPKSVAFAWRPYRPEVPVRSVVDVTLYGSLARVRQELSWKLPLPAKGETKTAPSKLRIPDAMGTVRVADGGTLLGNQPEKGLAWILRDGEGSVVLEFDLPLPWHGRNQVDKEVDWPVPLIWPAEATRKEVHLRLWCEGGRRLPRLGPSEGDWQERGIETLPGKSSLPALVLNGFGDDLALRLRWHSAQEQPLPILVAEKALLQVVLNEEGDQDYRVRFLVRKVRSRELDVVLPGGARGLQGIFLGDKRVPWEPGPGEPDRIRFRLDPEAIGAPTVLEFRYKASHAEVDQAGWGGHLLHPPRFLGRVFVHLPRWQIATPAGTLALATGPRVQPLMRWGFQGWLLGPEPALQGEELEIWLHGTNGQGTHASPGIFTPNLVAAQPTLEPLHLLLISRQAWLSACSGLLLVLGLLLGCLRLPGVLFWILTVGAAACLLLAAAYRPHWLPYALLGCQPGLLVLILVLAGQWLLQENYRRQVIFLPGFTRLKTGSSLVRPTGPVPGRETSTIDAPASAGSPGPGSASSRS